MVRNLKSFDEIAGLFDKEAAFGRDDEVGLAEPGDMNLPIGTQRLHFDHATGKVLKPLAPRKKTSPVPSTHRVSASTKVGKRGIKLDLIEPKKPDHEEPTTMPKPRTASVARA